jgi:hypothetical protein
VLSLFDYADKDEDVGGTPDPLIVGLPTVTPSDAGEGHP